MEEISAEVAYVEVEGVLHHFAHKGIRAAHVERPSGEIEVLLGMKDYALHPTGTKVRVDNLVFHSSIFVSTLSSICV